MNSSEPEDNLRIPNDLGQWFRLIWDTIPNDLGQWFRLIWDTIASDLGHHSERSGTP